MRRNRSEPLLFDPELEHKICRRRARERLVQVTTMENHGGEVPDPTVEAQIEAQVQRRLARRLIEQEQQDARRY